MPAATKGTGESVAISALLEPTSGLLRSPVTKSAPSLVSPTVAHRCSSPSSPRAQAAQAPEPRTTSRIPMVRMSSVSVPDPGEKNRLGARTIAAPTPTRGAATSAKIGGDAGALSCITARPYSTLWQQPPVREHRSRSLSPTRCHGRRINLHGCGLPLETEPWPRDELAVICVKQRQRLTRQQNQITRLTGSRLDPRRDVNGVADHRELQSSCTANIAGHHRSGVQPDPHRQRGPELVAHRVRDLHRGSQCPISVVDIAPRCPENREKSVACILVDVSAVPVNQRNNPFKEPVKSRHDLDRTEAFCESSEAADVDEH